MWKANLAAFRLGVGTNAGHGRKVQRLGAS